MFLWIIQFKKEEKKKKKIIIIIKNRVRDMKNTLGVFFYLLYPLTVVHITPLLIKIVQNSDVVDSIWKDKRDV